MEEKVKNQNQEEMGKVAEGERKNQMEWENVAEVTNIQFGEERYQDLVKFIDKKNQKISEMIKEMELKDKEIEN